MGMYDTYIPCKKLQEVVQKETGLKDFNWQTKSLDCNLDEYHIDQDLNLILNNRYPDLNIIDDPSINQGLLLLEFENGILESLLLSFNAIHTYGKVRKPDILITFNSLTDYEVTKIYDFNQQNLAIYKRNSLLNDY